MVIVSYLIRDTMDDEAMFGIPSDYYSLEEAPQHYPEDVPNSYEYDTLPDEALLDMIHDSNYDERMRVLWASSIFKVTKLYIGLWDPPQRLSSPFRGPSELGTDLFHDPTTGPREPGQSLQRFSGLQPHTNFLGSGMPIARHGQNSQCMRPIIRRFLLTDLFLRVRNPHSSHFQSGPVQNPHQDYVLTQSPQFRNVMQRSASDDPVQERNSGCREGKPESIRLRPVSELRSCSMIFVWCLINAVNFPL